MSFFTKNIKSIGALLFATALILFSVDTETITEKYFIGKWQSSKLETPIYLFANGEWEIKKDDGAVLQFGVWQYMGEKIIWSYTAGTIVEHDVNTVLSVTSQEFQLQENDRTTSTFKRLE